MPQPDSMAASDLLYEVEDGIGRVTFNRPQARNALTFAMYERLAQICAAADGDRSLKVLIRSGQGDKAFAAGTDINQCRGFKTPQDALDYESRIDRILSALEACRVPTIAAIAGACTGGGAGIAACCDLRIAAANAKFGFPIARTLGNCLSMASLSRPAAMGRRIVRQQTRAQKRRFTVGPLSGLKVIDLTHVMAGPTCTLMLADMGADVIKIEKSPHGDDSRYMIPPKLADEPAAFLMMNRNKRGMVIDLKKPGGTMVLRRLVKTADVMVENFAPGVMERRGLGDDVLRKVH